MKIHGVMIWVLLVMTLGSAFAQPLPPGTYRDLKPTRPLVLQKGAYVFINLTMRNMGKGIWLDGRKAKSLRLQDCRFEGNANGTAVVTNGNAQIIKSTFTNMKTGIQVLDKSGNTKTLTIQSNTFTNNQFGVYLDGGDLNLDLKCNLFEQTTSIPTGQERIGLRIGEDVSLAGNRIGGDETPATSNSSPNSNYWPREGSGISPGIFPGYTAILNASENQIKYWAYGNEYLGTVEPSSISLPNYVGRLELTNKYTVTPATIANFCDLYAGDCNYSTTGDCIANIVAHSSNLNCTENKQWVTPCSGTALDQTIFPVFKPNPDTSFHAQIMAQQERFGDKPFLGQSIPNPGNHKVIIPVFLPWDADGAELSVVESASGRRIKSIPLEKKGVQMVELEISQWPAGVYHYQLILRKSEPLKPMKMVIIR